jgi:hypothetical protein
MLALGEAGRGTATLLELLLAGGGAGFHQDVANAELLDEAQGFLAGAGADGQHANHGADAEDNAQSREQGAGLLGAEVGQSLADIGGGEDHCCNAFMALCGAADLLC